MIPQSNRQALLSKQTSQPNKVWLATTWKSSWHIEWKWAGKQFRSRMLFRFIPDGDWLQAESFEEDVFPTYKFAKECSK